MLSTEQYASLAKKAVESARKDLAEWDCGEQSTTTSREADSDVKNNVNNPVVMKKSIDVTEYYEDVNNMDLSQLIAAELETPLMSDDDDDMGDMSFPKLISYKETNMRPPQMMNYPTKVAKVHQPNGKSNKTFNPPKNKKMKHSTSSMPRPSKQELINNHIQRSKQQKRQNTSKTQEFKRPKEKFQSMLDAFKQRVIPERGVWVQCMRTGCNKWRYLSDVTDPSTVPELWSCDQNSDVMYNTCDKPEVDWKNVEQQQGFVDTKFTVGTIVWAKLAGYPWWPAMVEEDPNVGEYFWLVDTWRTNPTDYHVVFLDKNISRAWVNRSFIKIFSGPNQNLRCVKVKGKLFHQLEEAKLTAVKAKTLPIKERIAAYGFSSHYTGRWGGADRSLVKEFERKWPGHGKVGTIDTLEEKEDEEEDDEEDVETEEEIAPSQRVKHKKDNTMKMEKQRKRKRARSDGIKPKKSKTDNEKTNEGNSKLDEIDKPNDVYEFADNSLNEEDVEKQTDDNNLDNCLTVDKSNDKSDVGMNEHEKDDLDKEQKEKQQITEDTPENTETIEVDTKQNGTGEENTHKDDITEPEITNAVEDKNVESDQNMEEGCKQKKMMKKSKVTFENTELEECNTKKDKSKKMMKEMKTTENKKDSDDKQADEDTLSKDSEVDDHANVENDGMSIQQKKKKQKKVNTTTGNDDRLENLNTSKTRDEEKDGKKKKIKKQKKVKDTTGNADSVDSVENVDNSKTKEDEEKDSKKKKIKKQKKVKDTTGNADSVDSVENLDNSKTKEDEEKDSKKKKIKKPRKPKESVETDLSKKDKEKKNSNGLKKAAKDVEGTSKEKKVKPLGTKTTNLNKKVAESKEITKEVSKPSKLKPSFKAPRKKDSVTANKPFKPPTVKDNSNKKENSLGEENGNTHKVNITQDNIGNKSEGKEIDQTKRTDKEQETKEDETSINMVSKSKHESEKLIDKSSDVLNTAAEEKVQKDTKANKKEVTADLLREEKCNIFPRAEDQLVPSTDNDMDLTLDTDIDSWDQLTPCEIRKHNLEVLDEDDNSQPFEIEE
ncbi:uncharacterized protein [Antedon mediterranea]|uniref:uncharacterized protein n=1 Tax=Antedon mediterranea TaxID=105859 RepID=UPI003AF834B6